MSALRPLLQEVIQIELRQIRCLTMLGGMAADAFTRDIILSMIMEEAGEARFWNTVDAAYCGVEVTGGCPGTDFTNDPCPGNWPGMWPGMPGTCPTPGMPGTCPTPGMPGTCPTPGMPGSCPDPMPGMPGTCPGTCPGTPGMPGMWPGMPGSCPDTMPGMPGTCPGTPGMPGTCPGTPGTTCPGSPAGGTTTPAWNPGFFSEEAKKEEKE